MIEVRQFNSTNYLHISGSALKPLVFVIPGNPGVCDYYREYITELHGLTGYECVVVPQLGCDLYGREAERVWGLDEQVQHKVELVLGLGRGRDVVVLGHSIGAWMAQRVCVRVAGAVRVIFAGLLAPTIAEMAQSERGRGLCWFQAKFGEAGVCSVVGVARVLSWLPESVVRLAVELAVPAGGVAATLAAARRPSLVQQVLLMGFEEMERVREAGAADAAFWALGVAHWVMYAAGDLWVAEATKAATSARALAAGARVETRSVAHAFVLRSSADVARYTASALYEAAAAAAGGAAPPHCRSPPRA